MLRAYRDTFTTKVWDYWRKDDFAGLYRYLFGGARLVPGPAEDKPPGGGGVTLSGVQVPQVLYLKAPGVIGGDAGFTYNAATDALTLLGNLYLDDASDPSIYLREGGSASSYLQLADIASTQAYIRKYTAAGGSIIYIDAIPSDGTGTAYVTFFRATNTSGVSTIQVLKGDGTNTPMIHLVGKTGLVQGGPGTITLPTFAALADTHTGVYFPLDHVLGFVAGGAEVARVIAGALTPVSASGADLGSTSAEWANLYIGTGRAYFGAAQNASIWWDGTDLVIG